MSGRSAISERIRSNVWAIALCFAALTGTAIAAGSGGDRPKAKSSASATKQIKKLKRTVSGLSARLAALEAKPAPTVPTIPTSLPPSGAAGGDLIGTYPNPLIGPAAVGNGEIAAGTTLPPSGPASGELAGTYPNPTIGTAAGLNLLSATDAAGGINFGTDTDLFRSATETLTFQGTALHLDAYLRLSSRKVAGPPADTDCDANAEVARVIYNSFEDELYVCDTDAAVVAWQTLRPSVFQGTAGAATANALLFSVPELDVTITTDSVVGSFAGLKVQNDGAAAGPTIFVGTTADDSSGISVGPQDVSTSISGESTPLIVTNPSVPGASLMVTCTLAAGSNQICVGYLN